uniref:Putative nlr family apoptosis inhibitory protein 7 n=1 Tax=Ixodes ricinus TaxID=34613 RepID=A0A0K8RG35_IXORI
MDFDDVPGSAAASDDDDEDLIVCSGDPFPKIGQTGSFLSENNNVIPFDIAANVFKHIEKLPCPIHPDSSWSQIIELCNEDETKLVDVTDEDNCPKYPNEITMLRIDKSACNDDAIYQLCKKCRKLVSLEIMDGSNITNDSIHMICAKLRKLQHLVIHKAKLITDGGLRRLTWANIPLKTVCIWGCNGIRKHTFKRFLAQQSNILMAYCSTLQ